MPIDRRALVLLAAAGLAGTAAASAEAQQVRPPTGVQRPPATAPATTPARPPAATPTSNPAAARAGTAPGDTVPGDTVPADTAAVLTPRERALDRLRAMPSTPVQPLPAEPAEDEDEEAERTGAEDMDELPPEVRVEVQPTEPGATARGARQPPEDSGVTVREDSVRRLLAGLQGYTRTEYRGEAAVFEGAGNRLNLTGQSKVSRDGSAIETDSLLVYAGDRGIVCGYGNPVLTGEGDPLSSDRVCYDIEREIGMAEGARTQFVQQATWYVRGPQNRVYLVNERDRHSLYASNAQFTSCELEQPHYTFQAQSLKMVREDVMVARNVTLRFDDVPVFWLPWMVQSLKPDRRSGLLMPQFGVNDIVRNSSGYNRSVSNLGFFWAINDYMSTQATFEWLSNNYSAVTGNLTYRWLDQFLQGTVTARTYWHQSEFGPGRRDLTVNTANSWRPDERTNINVTGDYATSTELIKDYSFDPRELNRQITSSASVNRSFAWGTASLGAQRQQNLMDDRINWTLPSLSMSLRPITLYTSADGSQTLTWSGSGNARRALRHVDEMLPGAANRDQETITAGANHRVSFGRLSLDQRVNFTDQTDGFKPEIDRGPTLPADTALPERSSQNVDWGTNLSYQISLIPGTTLSPSLGITGRQLRNELTGGAYVAAPNRITTGASLGTTIYGFWPGFADFERIRHKISPNLSYSYSPKPDVSELQESIFGSLTNLRETNTIGLSFNQTFEAKVAEREPSATPNGRSPAGTTGANGTGANGTGEDGTDGDGTGADPAGAEAGDPVAAGDAGEPRRLPRSRIVNLLSISTSPALSYDFVRAREDGRGFMTDRLTNSIRSDLLPGLNLSFTHELFEYGDAPGAGELQPRTFDPFLTSLSTSFQIDQNFWLFRTLGLTRTGTGIGDGARTADEDAEEDDRIDSGAGLGSTIPRGGMSSGRSSAGLQPGGWNASLNYVMSRQRPDPTRFDQQASQTVRGQVSFQPTEHWSVSWSTGYSFTDNEFSDHLLTLTRDLHRWSANFHFIRAQNGNFAMRFNVQLRDNPDLKVDYDQHTTGVDRRRAQEGF